MVNLVQQMQSGQDHPLLSPLTLEQFLELKQMVLMVLELLSHPMALQANQ